MMSNNVTVYLVVYPNDNYNDNDNYAIFRDKDVAIQACLDFCEDDRQFYEMYNDEMSNYEPDEYIEYEDWLIEGFDPMVDDDDFPKIYEKILR